MWKYLTNDKYNDFLLSLNLVNTTDIKMVKKILYNISNNIDANYDELIIRKKNGKPRFIHEPSSELKIIQKNILKNILEDMKLSRYSYAYKKGCSLKDNVIQHVNKNVVVKLDIKNFFDSITFDKVYKTCFNETLYPESLGILLTNLCVYNNKLPQGAPTSGYISNLVMRNFDETIGYYCDENNISYSRYCDDMTFSGNFNVNKLILYVKDLLKEKNFKLNERKTRIIKKNNRQQITGIVVNEKINICKKYKRKIRQEIYYIYKYGLTNHLLRINYEKKEKDYLLSLLGKVNYVYNIIPTKEFKNFYNYLMELLKKY